MWMEPNPFCGDNSPSPFSNNVKIKRPANALDAQKFAGYLHDYKMTSAFGMNPRLLLLFTTYASQALRDGKEQNI